jgi:hypothetical protein
LVSSVRHANNTTSIKITGAVSHGKAFSAS